MSVIKVCGLTRDYGSNKGIFDINFSIEKGEVFGFLGPNSAGKTTTIRHLMGFLKPQQGSCTVSGLDCRENAAEIQKNLGYIPGEIALFDDMSGIQYLRFMQEYRGIDCTKRMNGIIERFELDPNLKIKKMSKGMKQKIAIAAAFMHDPDILILDEPTSGLDPLMQNRFIELIKEEKQRGKTVLMSSHMFEEVEKISGNVLRSVKTRRTLRFDFEGRSYYLKLHHGTSYGEVFKNLLTGKLPVLGADREWRAIHDLAKVGVDTMKGVAFGQKGTNPVKRTSFIITEDLSPTISLEDYCRNWASNPPNVSIKRMLIERVAEMVRKMHSIGINHRDCYICHFLLHLPFNGEKNKLKLSIIDLHRAQFRSEVPLRWRNKDLIGLYYSCLNIGLSDTDYYRFLKIYFQKPLKEIFQTEKALITEAKVKAEKIRERSARRGL